MGAIIKIILGQGGIRPLEYWKYPGGPIPRKRVINVFKKWAFKKTITQYAPAQNHQNL